jgi:hypothetical protein
MGLLIFITGVFVGLGGLMLLLQIIKHITSAETLERANHPSSRYKDR